MVNNFQKFKSIEEFINTLSKNNLIVGIVEYGSRNYRDVKVGGDYDLTIILNNDIFKSINGVHFYIESIPIDCMIKSISDFYKEPSNIFDYVHLDCKIIYDKDGSCEKALNNIKKNWNAFPKFNEIEVSKKRYLFSHGFYKLNIMKEKKDFNIPERAIYYNDIMSYLISHTLDLYGKAKKLPVGKKLLFIEHMKKNDSNLFENYLQYINCDSILKKYYALCKICENILKSFGGFWMENEILFHGKDSKGGYPIDEVNSVTKLLFEYKGDKR